MDLFLREAADRIGDDDVLAKTDALMDWQSFSPILKRGLGRSGEGPSGYDPLVLFKCLLIGQSLPGRRFATQICREGAWIERPEAGTRAEVAAGFHDLLRARPSRPGSG